MDRLKAARFQPRKSDSSTASSEALPPREHANALPLRFGFRGDDRCAHTSFTFFSGKLRTGLPVAAKIALSTAGATTQIVGSPTPPQKS